MKKVLLFIILLISVAGFSQDFEKNWNKVYNYEYEGKPKNASKEVNKIYCKARRNKSELEMIRTFIYQSKYLQILEEDAQFKIITNLQTEIKEQNGISKSIFNYIYRKILYDYYSKNRYTLLKTISTDTIYNPDFRTWSESDFAREINKASEESIKDTQLLLNTPLKNFEVLLNFGINGNDLNISLYDFLASSHINNFVGESEYFKEYNFVKRNFKAIYSDTDKFQRLNLDSIRGTILFKKLSIYQTLEKDYTSKNNDYALAQTILKRIKTIHYLSLYEEEYLSSLENFATKFQSYKQDFQMEIAKVYTNSSNQAGHFTDYKIKALALADTIIASNHERSSRQAKQLKLSILQKQIYITTQENIIPNKPSRALVNYKNIDTIYSSLYKIPSTIIFDKNEDNYSERKKYTDSLSMDLARRQKPYLTFERVLPNKKDYLQHTTEIILPALEKGKYLMLTSLSKDSINQESAVAYTVINASDLMLSYSNLQNTLRFQVLNRKTGKPVEDANITIENKVLKTDFNGYAMTDVISNKKNIKLQLIHKNDTITENFYNYRYEIKPAKEEKMIARVNLFTDRAIYRPAQNVFFKGILIQNIEKKTTVVPNVYVRIIAENTNGDEIYSARLKTNEFGSITGEFTIPKNSLTGNFTIFAEEDDDYKSDELYEKKTESHPFWDKLDHFQTGTNYFLVEEYKRPKFEIVFEPVKENFVIGQKIKVKGKAMAFAGSAISDAKMTYSISRNIIQSNTNSNKYYDENDNYTISNKNLVTDKDGNFEIDFTASTAQVIDEDETTVFEYFINVQITDINGETRKNNIKVKVGNYNLVLSTKTKEIVEASDNQTISLTSTNLNGYFTPVIGEVKIYKLKAPDRILGSRAWHAPDIQTISEEDFIKLFPYEPYFNENEITKWANQKLVFSKTINTEKDKKIILENLEKFESGNYKLFFKAKDSAGKEIETTNYFKIYNKKENIAPDKQLFNLDILNKNPKKDGFLDLKLSSSFPLLYINAEIFYDSGSIFNKVIKLNNEATIVRIPINKNWPNNLKIETDFVLENQTFDMTTEVDLSEIKETLNIETKSIRNKIEPGSIETWSFSIQNKDKNGIESEALANMYDSSLDQFANQTWPTNLGFNNYDDNDPDSKTFLNFGNTDSYFKNLNEDVPYFYASPIKNDLNWFGFDFVNPEKNVLIYKKYLTDKVAQHNGKYITGVVSDLTGPLPGATVNIAGTTRGAQTDIDGEYKIKALFGETLIFSYLGYDDSSITINDNTIDATLIEGVTTGEVVVTGALGIKKKLNAVGSSYFFEENEITTPSSALQMLTGRVSGVQINTNPNEDYIVIKGSGSLTEKDKALIVIDGKVENLEVFSKINPSTIFSITTLKESQGVELYGSQGKNGVLIVTTFASLENLNKVETRKNLAESAFFLPQLKTDSKGNLSFNFTSPEALTKWKLQIFAHNKKAVSGYFESLIVTQKDIMVIPNLPRFLREKDTITITTKIANMTSEAKSGMAMLQLFDAVSMEPIDAKMLNSINTKSFQLNAKGNTSVSWKIYVPEGLQGVQYKIVAKAGNFSDGEENILPVLTNNMLVTESIPVWVRENSSKEYTFENLKNNTSNTLRNQQLTFEYTSNPTWLAIQALPYLMEYEHECAEQTFARYYANALASEILNSNPKIAEVFESWKKSEKPISKLEQNEELKSILLAETPWITNALSEEEKKKNLATLFDLQKMKDSQKAILEKLTKKQKASGGFAWFDDGTESEYITRHIISGLGHLQKLSKNATGDFDQITKNGVSFLDQKFLEYHKKTEENNKSQKLIWIYPYNNLHYLYARSFYLEKYPLPATTLAITKNYTANIKENWLNYSLYEKGLASLVLSRFGEKEMAKTILESLRQTSSNNENWGMYWIENKSGWYWYQAPIETQALLIEAFAEIENDKKSVDAMKVWLLKNKQNKNWPTTKATTEAVYALLMQGNDWISVKDKTVIKLGDEKIVTKKLSENEKEAGTGYIKMNWKSDEITKEMATVSINNKSEVPGFGGFYWQYFEELDKIKSSQGGPMTIEKELYLKATTSEGNQLQRITSEKSLKIGDLVTVRLVISTKEEMEFVHLKDMRASCFEPIDVLSKYKWQDGLGYYQSTKDVATHFFFDRIKKGKFVLEYDIRVNNLGDFSNGITTIQSMYAPEFSSHTKGIRVKIEE